MNASFGIDHPLLATKDIASLRNRLSALGFNMTPIGKHPWGTSTSLAMFDGCLLEIMGIYDDTLLDEKPAGEFRFGRHVYEHLQIREGVALSALHSTDSLADAQHALNAGFEVAGHLEFGRDVELPDGTTDRTKTTLALLPDAGFPRLSFFLCQQHRPDLIYVPQWLEHPNTATGICGISIIAQTVHHEALKKRFQCLYGAETTISGGMQFPTANGTISILQPTAFEQSIGPLPKSLKTELLPAIASLSLVIKNPDTMLSFIENAGMRFNNIENGFVLQQPELTANTTLCFNID